jgi:hypothetical protein
MDLLFNTGWMGSIKALYMDPTENIYTVLGKFPAKFIRSL